MTTERKIAISFGCICMLTVFVSIICAAVSMAHDNSGGVIISMAVALVADWLGSSVADVLRKNLNGSDHPRDQ